MTLRIRIVIAVAVVMALGLAPGAWAQAGNTPVGLWSLTFYNDATPNMTQMATQNICFQAAGTWYSTTYPNWTGRWFQKGANGAGNGDHVHVAGNFWSGRGNDAGQLDFTHSKLMTGPWTEWVDGFTYYTWHRMQFIRIGTCGPFTLDTNAVDPTTAPSETLGVPGPVCTAVVDETK